MNIMQWVCPKIDEKSEVSFIYIAQNDKLQKCLKGLNLHRIQPLLSSVQTLGCSFTRKEFLYLVHSVFTELQP